MGIYPQSDQLHYRQILGGMMHTKGELRARRAQPEVIVKLQLADDEEKIVRELLGNPNLEFKVVAVDSPDGVSIALHIKLKHDEGKLGD